ncbi:hypothetical protein CNR22_05435 [Sphingobacteriaceae bacterium]|nr:hypothetical protein CNR22_05435 [Sphingobacteriaceae bacterium]
MNKKILPILFCLVIFSSLKSQSLFCPPGAQWRYVYNAFNLDPTPEFVNVAAWNAGTTTVNGETVTILKHNKLFSQYNIKTIYESYLKEVGDTVFMKSAVTNDQWRILFNFAATAGQSWVTPLNFSGVSFTVTIDSVSTAITNGISLKTLHAVYNQSNPSRSYHSTITERIGGYYYLFNFWRGPYSDGDYMTDFLCYQDSALGLVQFSNKPCNYSNLTGLSEENQTRILRIFPNPAADFLYLDVAQGRETEARIIDISGKEVRKIKFDSNSKIPVYDLPYGIYLLTIFEGTEKIYSTKFIKE